MTRELRVTAILIILMVLMFAGWRIAESMSVLRERDFLNMQVDPLNPTLQTSAITP